MISSTESRKRFLNQQRWPCSESACSPPAELGAAADRSRPGLTSPFLQGQQHSSPEAARWDPHRSPDARRHFPPLLARHYQKSLRRTNYAPSSAPVCAEFHTPARLDSCCTPLHCCVI